MSLFVETFGWLWDGRKHNPKHVQRKCIGIPSSLIVAKKNNPRTSLIFSIRKYKNVKTFQISKLDSSYSYSTSYPFPGISEPEGIRAASMSEEAPAMSSALRPHAWPGQTISDWAVTACFLLKYPKVGGVRIISVLWGLNLRPWACRQSTLSHWLIFWVHLQLDSPFPQIIKVRNIQNVIALSNAWKLDPHN